VGTHRIIVEMKTLQKWTWRKALDVFCSGQTIERQVEMQQRRAARKRRNALDTANT
jgi:hypothetical protein